MANVASRFPAVENGISLFSPLASLRNLGAYKRCIEDFPGIAYGREPEPSAAILDSQSVKTTETPFVSGYSNDTGKKVKGRKRHIIVDTIGLLLIVIVHAANIRDRDGLKPNWFWKKLSEHSPDCSSFGLMGAMWLWGYAGQLVDWVKVVCGWVLEIVKRSDDVKDFQVLPHRWIVERTFGWLGRGWLGRYRRLSKDYEELTRSSEAMVYAAMIHLMVKRLGRIKPYST